MYFQFVVFFACFFHISISFGLSLAEPVDCPVNECLTEPTGVVTVTIFRTGGVDGLNNFQIELKASGEQEVLASVAIFAVNGEVVYTRKINLSGVAVVDVSLPIGTFDLVVSNLSNISNIAHVKLSDKK